MDDAEFAARRRTLSQQLVAFLAAMFMGLGDWRDADADRFVEQAVPAVQSGQELLGQLTALYVAAQAAETIGGAIPAPALARELVSDLRTGVTPDEVYRRPFSSVYAALARGDSLDLAVQRGATRLGQVAEMDLQQTYAHASQAAMRGLPRRAQPRYWARVLQGPGDCALCVVASTQRYTIGDLNPIHPGCDCIVKSLAPGMARDHVIAPELLERVHTEVAALTGKVDRGARSPDYRKLMTQMTGRHSEVGPMLHDPNDRFTTGRDL